jgi:hypothetical protein
MWNFHITQKLMLVPHFPLPLFKFREKLWFHPLSISLQICEQ